MLDIGNEKIKMFIMISAEHIYVDPIQMKPFRKLSIALKLRVFVIVSLSVYRLITNIPSASNTTDIYISCFKDSFLFMYATPMILDKLIAPMQNPVITANTKEQYANSQLGKSTAWMF